MGKKKKQQNEVLKMNIKISLFGPLPFEMNVASNLQKRATVISS